MHLLHVVGARPNFMKAAPVLSAASANGAQQTLVHTGQHYDANMSDAFFRELQLPEPDVNLGVGSGTHAEQTASVIVGIERCLDVYSPDIVLVYGDVNSTMAATLAAAKLGIPVAHVEAGLRSRDLTMPEEINRMVTDRLATWLYTPSPDGDANLIAEGTRRESIRMVGNVMIDTLVRLLPRTAPEPLFERFSLLNGTGPRPYALVTLHRPSNVDDQETLQRLCGALVELSREMPIVFPAHPRTRSRIPETAAAARGLCITEPLTYLEFLALQQHAAVVITDSGGIQEETTFLGIPCLTMRENTERPVTVTTGTNQLVGQDTELLKGEVLKVLSGRGKCGTIPDLWDGRAGQRIANHLASLTAGSAGRF